MSSVTSTPSIALAIIAATILGLALLAADPALAQQVPAAIVADPPADKEFPAALAVVSFPSSPRRYAACGPLTDVVLERAIAARARVAVLPCCHDVDRSDPGGLSGWMNDALAIDAMRARRLAGAGYRIWTHVIPDEITPKNRLLIGAFDDGPVGP